jgi:FkbM family methyltransferase
MFDTFHTRYGKVSLYKNDAFIRQPFVNGSYWDEETLIKLKQFIDTNKNIIEIGGHCGTSTLIYASYISNDNKVFVYEPQEKLFNLLLKNINDNNLQNKIIPYNKGVFCYEGKGNMNDIDLDGGRGIVEKRYGEESHLNCNFGGITLGRLGETIDLTTIDRMGHENIGFIHCDAQGSENFIFSDGIETITKNRPVILYENNSEYGKYLYASVCKNYPQFEKESKFNLKTYCKTKLKYRGCVDKFNGGIDTLLIP